MVRYYIEVGIQYRQVQHLQVIAGRSAPIGWLRSSRKGVMLLLSTATLFLTMFIFVVFLSST